MNWLRIAIRGFVLIVIAAAVAPANGDGGTSTINFPLDYASDSYTAFALQFTNAIAADAESDTLVILQANGQVTNTTGWVDAPPGLSNVTSLACGFAVCMALRNDGTFVAWGDNEFGQNDVPPGLSNVVAITAGWWHALALLSNGTVASWGEGTVTNVPVGLSNVVAIAAGEERSLALQANGTVTNWGPAAYAIPSGLTNVIAISADYGADFALLANGTVLEWDDSFTNLLAGVTNAVAIAGDSQTYIALKANGSIISGGTTTISFSNSLSNAFAISVGQFINTGTVITGNGSPAFTVQPGNQTTGSGGTIWLHARAVGIQPMAYQWQLNGTTLAGATNDDLIITNAATTNGGQYQALATNSVGSTASSTASVAVLPPVVRIPVQLNAPVAQPDGSWLVTASAGNNAPFLFPNTAPFVIEGSSDLINWNPLTNVLIEPNGEIDFRDPQAPASPARFYRLLRQ